MGRNSRYHLLPLLVWGRTSSLALPSIARSTPRLKSIDGVGRFVKELLRSCVVDSTLNASLRGAQRRKALIDPQPETTLTARREAIFGRPSMVELLRRFLLLTKAAHLRLRDVVGLWLLPLLRGPDLTLLAT